MRILVIAKDFPTPANPFAGIFVLRQAQALARLGHELFVVRVVPHAPPVGAKWRAYRETPDTDVVGGIPVRTVRALVLPRMIGTEYLPRQVGATLRRVAREFAPDLVHAHFLIPSGQLATALPYPAVVTAHGSDAYDWAWRRRGLRRAAFEAVRRAARIVAVSDFVRERVARLGTGRVVDVIFNGADAAVFHPQDRHEARTLLGIPSDRFVVSFAGRPTRAKGAFDLIEAIGRLHDIAPLLLLAGDLPDPALCEFIARNNADVRALGPLDHPQLARAYAAADVFCLPSYNEGLPASICEAMLAGRPIVATPVGGIPEIVHDGVDGYLVPNDPGALAERLLRLARNPADVHRFGAAAHAFARDHLTWEKNARLHERLYRQVLSSAASAELG